MITARADVVGSLLRPLKLQMARERMMQGLMEPDICGEIEDAAVDAAVAMQEAVGLTVVTDGEMRRMSFQSVLSQSVEGLGEHDLQAFLWGDWHSDGEAGSGAGQHTVPRPANLGVVSPLRRTGAQACEEFYYLREQTQRTIKVCLPSPSLWVNFWDPERSTAAYPTLDAFLGDVANLLREEVSALARLGCTYIQLDAPHYTALLSPETRAFYDRQGWDADAWLARGIELDNAVLSAPGAEGVTFAFHLCRGNQDSRWLVSGDYAPLATLLRGVRAQRLMLEFDDARSGGFEPLAQLPDDKTVVLGLITTKTPALEDPALVEARIRAAAQIVPLERLALSTQCGFASSVVGNRLSEEDQAAKLRLVVEVAQRVWG